MPEHGRHDMLRTRLMGAFFALGGCCFLIGPLDAYANAVGSHADGLTFFIGSILFTLGGLTQCLLAAPERAHDNASTSAWRAAWVQAIGTVLFNFMTFQALATATSSSHYLPLVWTPNALGSVCFLASGALLYLSSPRHGWRPARADGGWWEAAVNLLGCVLFGISALTALAFPAGHAMLSTTLANWTTTLGAACFITCALAAAAAGHTVKAPRLTRLRALQAALERDLKATEQAARREAQATERALVSELDTVGREAKHAERAITSELDVAARETQHLERALVSELDGAVKRAARAQIEPDLSA